MSGTLLGRVWDKVAGRRKARGAEAAEAAEAPRTQSCRVQLVVTPLGPSMRRFQAYHTSLLIAGTEYSFSSRGITRTNGVQSHEAVRRNPSDTEVIDMGEHALDLADFGRKMGMYFQRNTYDLLRKNCNSFSDVALYYATGQRLPKSYRVLEAIGHAADRYTSFVQALSGGTYQPNPRAEGFDATTAIYELCQSSSTLFGLPLCAEGGGYGRCFSVGW